MAAKKQEEAVSLVKTFEEFNETKKIDRNTLMSVLEESFRNVLSKIFGSDENFDVIVNPEKGDFEIYWNRIVVPDGEVEDENKQISLSEVHKTAPDFEVGEEFSERVDFSKFGRRAILNLRQTLASKVLELEHDSLYNKYKDRVGQVISGEVYQVWKREVLLVDD
ncbi:MAG: transcription termination/antitermination protein NusA, partial [Prevotella sp.]|nr:transcription termination/antitermination protein NusA [Prevotella sp.]